MAIDKPRHPRPHIIEMQDGNNLAITCGNAVQSEVKIYDWSFDEAGNAIYITAENGSYNTILYGTISVTNGEID